MVFCSSLSRSLVVDDIISRTSAPAATIAGATVRNEVSTSLRENIGFPDHIKRILDFYKVHK